MVLLYFSSGLLEGIAVSDILKDLPTVDRVLPRALKVTDRVPESPFCIE
jgi:hypothetical protein